MGDEILTLNEVHFHPDEGMFHGEADDGTVYWLKMADDELAEMRARGAHPADRRCPRCDFEEAINTFVYAGDFIREHYDPDEPNQLNGTEQALVDAGRAWLTDDTIRRCLDGEQA